jgi:hypothetical protein
MADEADLGNDRLEEILSDGLAAVRRQIKPLEPHVGPCFCLAEMNVRFCGPECRDDWQRAQDAMKRNGRVEL